MPIYDVEQYELHAQTYRVEAASEAEAIAKVLDSEADALDDACDYIEVPDVYGMSEEEPGAFEIISELRRLGYHIGQDGYVDSIRSVTEVKPEA